MSLFAPFKALRVQSCMALHRSAGRDESCLGCLGKHSRVLHKSVNNVGARFGAVRITPICGLDPIGGQKKYVAVVERMGSPRKPCRAG